MRYCTLGTSAHRIERAMTPVALKIFMALTVVMLTGTTFSSTWLLVETRRKLAQSELWHRLG